MLTQYNVSVREVIYIFELKLSQASGLRQLLIADHYKLAITLPDS
jgi:hypothetical protein